MNAPTLARVLGWFSIGLGVAELVGAGTLSRWLGMPRRAGLIRVLGVREVVNGVGILSDPTSPALLWARAGGDAMDLALLKSVPVYPARARANVGLAVAVVAGVAALDVVCAAWLGRHRHDVRSGWVSKLWG